MRGFENRVDSVTKNFPLLSRDFLFSDKKKAAEKVTKSGDGNSDNDLNDTNGDVHSLIQDHKRVHEIDGDILDHPLSAALCGCAAAQRPVP